MQAQKKSTLLRALLFSILTKEGGFENRVCIATRDTCAPQRCRPGLQLRRPRFRIRTRSTKWLLLWRIHRATALDAVVENARGSDVAAAAKATTSPPPASRRGVLMSCPAGGAAHNPGSWKPNYLSDGIKAVAQQLVSFHSKLELVVRATPNTLPMSTHPGLPLLCPTCCIYITSS